MSDGCVVPRDALFVPPRFVPNNQLIVDLGCDVDDGWVATDATGRTSVPGVWAAGPSSTRVLRSSPPPAPVPRLPSRSTPISPKPTSATPSTPSTRASRPDHQELTSGVDMTTPDRRLSRPAVAGPPTKHTRVVGLARAARIATPRRPGGQLDDDVELPEMPGVLLHQMEQHPLQRRRFRSAPPRPRLPTSSNRCAWTMLRLRAPCCRSCSHTSATSMPAGTRHRPSCSSAQGRPHPGRGSPIPAIAARRVAGGPPAPPATNPTATGCG